MPTTLPLNKPVDAAYMPGGKIGDTTIINPAVAEWMQQVGADGEAKALWKPVDWKTPVSLSVPMGIVDNPYQAEQRVLKIDPAGDPIAVFGAAGRGKSTFLKALAITLAAARSPVELHMYAFDFGRGGLKALKTLPHMGGIVDANEDERVERLFRMLWMTLSERQKKLAAYDSLADYNAQNPEAAFPSILVLIDNVTEFRETYERFQGDLIALVRDGRSFGVHFVMTAALYVDMHSKLFSLVTNRISFTQAEVTDYTTIVGRGWTRFPDTPGRGLKQEVVGEMPVPLEFHTGLPVGEGDVDYVRELAQRMGQAWAALEAKVPQLKALRPKPVEPLSTQVDLAGLLPAKLGRGTKAKAAQVGLNDANREPTLIELGAKGPNLIVIGPPVTGKTTLLRSLVLSLAYNYSPDQLALVLIDPSDPSRRFYNFGTSDENRLDRLPHVLATAAEPAELQAVIQKLTAEFDEQVIARLSEKPEVFSPQDNKNRAIVVIIDHYDDADSTFNKRAPLLADLSQVGKGKNMHLILGGTLAIMRTSGDDLRRRAESARYTLVMNDFETVRFMGVRANLASQRELPAGRGFLIKAVSMTTTQIAMPSVDGRNGQTEEQQLDHLFNAIKTEFGWPAQWSYTAADLTMLEQAIAGEPLTGVREGGAAPEQENRAANSALSALAELAKMQESMNKPVAFPEFDPSLRVEKEFPDVPGGNGQTPEGSAAGDNGRGAADDKAPEKEGAGAGKKKAKK